MNDYHTVQSIWLITTYKTCQVNLDLYNATSLTRQQPLSKGVYQYRKLLIKLPEIKVRYALDFKIGCRNIRSLTTTRRVAVNAL